MIATRFRIRRRIFGPRTMAAPKPTVAFALVTNTGFVMVRDCAQIYHPACLGFATLPRLKAPRVGCFTTWPRGYSCGVCGGKTARCLWRHWPTMDQNRKPTNESL